MSRLFIVGSLALFILLVQVPAAAIMQPHRTFTSVIGPAPAGLVVVIKNAPGSASSDAQSLNNPYITGAALQIHWSDIEAVEGSPDWSRLDALFAAAAVSKKWVQLSIYPGFFTPAWALKGVQTEKFAVQYGPDKGAVMELPVPWDSVYLGRWITFLGLVSARYGTSPAFRVISAAGPTSVSEEMTLPTSAAELTTWQSLGYTSSKYIGAYRRVFQACATAFPNQYVSLAVGNALDIDDKGKKEHGEGASSRQTIIDSAMGLLGRRFLLENHDLHANLATRQAATSFVMSYVGRVTVGLEMRCAAELGTCSSGMGAAGNPPLALQKSIDLGMEPNRVAVCCQHVNYLEIYEPDILAAEMQPVLRETVSLFAAHPRTPRTTPRY